MNNLVSPVPATGRDRPNLLKCESGGIGRRTRLRMWIRPSCTATHDFAQSWKSL